MIKTIYLHGFSGDGAGLMPLMDQVGYEQSQCIDLPAFGRNSRVYDLNWHSYVEATMATIRASGHGPYRLIGHSHGAMVAYGLAAQHPDEIASVVLICPVARGSLLGRVFINSLRAMRRILGGDRATRLQRQRFFVDIVTRLSKRPEWTREAYGKLRAQRRRESERYTLEMVKLLDIIPRFKEVYQSSQLSCPVGIIAARDDVLVPPSDIKWYVDHSPENQLVYCRGGHLAPAVMPHDIAELVRHIGTALPR